MSSKPRSHSSAEIPSALEHKSDKRPISMRIVETHTSGESETEKVQDLTDFLNNLDTANDTNEDDDSSKTEKGRKRNSTVIGTNVADELKGLRTSDKKEEKENSVIANSISETTPSKRPSSRRRKNGEVTLRGRLTKSPSTFLESVWNANEILNGIYIGDVDSSRDIVKLQEHNITHIICLLGDSPPSFPQEIKYLVIDALDSGDYDMLSNFPETNKFIAGALLSNQGVLVHCHKGVSRSATVVLGYLMSEMKYSFDSAVDLVSQKRPVACPNLGFIKQLKLYEQIQYKLQGNTEAHEIYRRFKLKNKLRDVKTCIGDTISEESPFVYLCKVCKFVLLNANTAIEHDPGIQDDFSLLTSKSTERKERECNLIFSLPHQWMGGQDMFSEDSGRFRCPSCSTLLGKWNLAGESCMCGVTMKPAFLVFSALVSREQTINLTDTIKERSQISGRKSLPWKWSVNNISRKKKTEDEFVASSSEKSPGKRSGFVSPLSPKKSSTLTSETKQRVRNTHGTLRNYRGSKDIDETIPIEVESKPPQQITEIEIPSTSQSEPTTPVKVKRTKKFAMSFKLPAILKKKEEDQPTKERKFFNVFKKDKSKRESQL